MAITIKSTSAPFSKETCIAFFETNQVVSFRSLIDCLSAFVANANLVFTKNGITLRAYTNNALIISLELLKDKIGMLSYKCQHDSIVCGFHFPKLQNYMKHMPESSKLGIYIMEDYFNKHVVYFTCLQKANQICTWYKVHLLHVDERVDFTSMPPYIPIDSMVCLPQTDFCHIVRAHMAVPCTTSNGLTLQISTKIENGANICTFVTEADDTVETVVGFASGVDGSLCVLKQRLQEQQEEDGNGDHENPMFVNDQATVVPQSAPPLSVNSTESEHEYVEVCIPGSGSAVYLRCYHRASANKCLYPLKPICTFLKFANMSSIVEMFLQNSKDFPLFLRLSVGLMGYFTITIPPIGSDIESDFEPNLATNRLPQSISTSVADVLASSSSSSSSVAPSSLPSALAVSTSSSASLAGSASFQRISKKNSVPTTAVARSSSSGVTATITTKRKGSGSGGSKERASKKAALTVGKRVKFNDDDDGDGDGDGSEDDVDGNAHRRQRNQEEQDTFDREVNDLLDNSGMDDFFK